MIGTLLVAGLAGRIIRNRDTQVPRDHRDGDLTPDDGPTDRYAPATCLCRHTRDVHQHYRDGSDCGVCGRGQCPTYRAARRAS